MSMALYFHILNTEVFEYSFILVLLFLFLFLFLFFLVFFYSITFFFSYTTITPVIMWIIVLVGYYTIILVCQILSYLLRLLHSFLSYFSFFFSILVSIIFWYISITFHLILSYLSSPLLSSPHLTSPLLSHMKKETRQGSEEFYETSSCGCTGRRWGIRMVQKDRGLHIPAYWWWSSITGLEMEIGIERALWNK